MTNLSKLTFVFVVLFPAVWAAPASSPSVSPSVSAPQASSTVPLIKDVPNDVLPTGGVMEPIRGTLGADIIGPDNQPLDVQNPDLLAPPTTDQGTV